ncbi:MAG: hybrid sensor histidine kinase/response regulator [Cereibacter sphaeroides]|uniref:histidine kinase n=1 Tax=Cereibacter sphaeroides TaxID=1063 RepID=A0A2W5SCA4_CERSP|nr:MAG: hybrid sensor histidine kinase/response regulator [Cereibacter sphaeroides]
MANAGTFDLSAAAQRVAPRTGILFVAALTLGLGALILPEASWRLGALSAALTLCLLACVIRVLAARENARKQLRRTQIAALVEDDAAPCFTTDAEGEIGYQNAAAVKRFAALVGQTLASAIGDHFVSPGAVLYRLQSRAAAKGSAREDIVTRRGHTRLSVHRVGENDFLWRLEEMLERTSPGRGAEALSLPMLVSNKSGVVLFMNEAMRRLLGGRPRHLDRIFPNIALRSGEETVVSTLDGPVRAIAAEVEGPGERREIYLLPLSDQPAPAERADFDHLPVALATLLADGSIQAANIAARELLYIGEGTTARLSDLLEGLGRSLGDWIGDVLAERVPGGSEVLRLRHSEAETFLQVTLRRITQGGRPLALAVLNDATEFKTLEAQLVQSQKMHTIGQFAGGIAHDLNNVLTAISGHCDLLLLRHDADEVEYADLIQIHQNSNRAASLVGKLLAYSRKQTLRLERVDLFDVLSETTHLLHRLIGEKIQLSLRHAPSLGPIRADRHQLEQVLINLATNARDAMMPKGGTIEIATREIVLSGELRRNGAVVPPGKYALITVTDTGHGIPPDRIQKVFEPFYTTKRPGEGTGLGLATAYGTIKQTGGFIFIDSEVGVGTTFLLYFPIHETPVEVETPEPIVVANRKMTRQGEGVVLLVEDEAPVRAFASRALRLRGYTVLEAENAEAALTLLEDPGVEVDVFVTDVVMPGLDGPSWVRKALEQRPNVKVVFVSGYAEDSFSEVQGQIANSVFLPKPFSLNDLTATVQGQLLH